jgi:hypothetical protein
LGKQHPSTAASYNNISATYKSMSDHANAYQYAKNILDKQLPDMTASYDDIDTYFTSITYDYEYANAYHSIPQFLDLEYKIKKSQTTAIATGYRHAIPHQCR